MENMEKRIIFLRWLDSALMPEWTYLAEQGLTEIVSVGYLVFEDDKHIQIAQSIYEEGDKYSAIQSIPKSVILERRTIHFQKFRKK